MVLMGRTRSLTAQCTLDDIEVGNIAQKVGCAGGIGVLLLRLLSSAVDTVCVAIDTVCMAVDAVCLDWRGTGCRAYSYHLVGAVREGVAVGVWAHGVSFEMEGEGRSCSERGRRRMKEWRCGPLQKVVGRSHSN